VSSGTALAIQGGNDRIERSDTMAYRWASVHDWHSDFVDRLVESGDLSTIVFELRELADAIDPDRLQDMYQNQMSLDGFFDDDTETPETEE